MFGLSIMIVSTTPSSMVVAQYFIKYAGNIFVVAF